mgnify:CR=1 FL=1|tara:strand:+ start:2203 stop:3207 length:1005 start_codon:yes stop_codon:yes gene_type:complete
MALDYSKLSDEELEAISKNDYSKLSDTTLNAIANEPTTPEKTATAGDVVQQAAQSMAPAAMYGATGLPELAKTAAAAAQPMLGVGKGVLQSYAKNPAGMVADAVLLHGGVPPLFGGVKTAEGLYNTYKGAKEGANIIGQELSQGAAATTPVKGLPTTETIKPFGEMRTAAGANSELGMKLKNLYDTGGGNNAVKSFLASAEGQAAQAANPQFAQSAQKYLQAVPGIGTQAMKVLGPLAKGAMKVAGPAGMALNVYDAGQMARETELGSRLQQGQGQQAESAFRNMNTQYAGPISPEEAQNVLSSGSARDIKAFGGRDRLNLAVRMQAAKRIIGQ